MHYDAHTLVTRLTEVHCTGANNFDKARLDCSRILSLKASCGLELAGKQLYPYVMPVSESEAELKSSLLVGACKRV